MFKAFLVRRKGPRIALQSAWLGDPRLCLRYPPAPLFAKNSTLYCFFTLRPSQGSSPYHMNNPADTTVSAGLLVRRKGLEPPTYWFVASHSIQLSYRRICSNNITQCYLKCKTFFKLITIKIFLKLVRHIPYKNGAGPFSVILLRARLCLRVVEAL